jgi:DNA invertase Pin-like site-specific DNA recombinase
LAGLTCLAMKRPAYFFRLDCAVCALYILSNEDQFVGLLFFFFCFYNQYCWFMIIDHVTLVLQTGAIMKRKAISYIRVSTDNQGKTGYGLEDQRQRIVEFCDDEGFELVEFFCDVDSGSKSDRPELMKAIALAKETGATIVCARLCRLSRSAHFITGLIAHGVPFIVAEFGNVPTFQLHLYAILGEEERRRIGANTKKALQVAKSRGVKLGTHNPKVLAGVKRRRAMETNILLERVEPIILEARNEGCRTIQSFCDYLNDRDIKTTRGKDWTTGTLARVLKMVKARHP